MGEGNASTVNDQAAGDNAGTAGLANIACASACVQIANGIAREAVDLSSVLSVDTAEGHHAGQPSQPLLQLRSRLLYVRAELDTCKALAAEARAW